MLLEVEIDTDLNTLREGDLAIIDTLHISSVREGVFGIHSLVGGQTYEVLTGDEDGAALDEAPQFLVPGIGEGHIAQFDVGGILDVAVGEVIVPMASPHAARGISVISPSFCQRRTTDTL